MEALVLLALLMLLCAPVALVLAMNALRRQQQILHELAQLRAQSRQPEPEPGPETPPKVPEMPPAAEPLPAPAPATQQLSQVPVQQTQPPRPEPAWPAPPPPLPVANPTPRVVPPARAGDLERQIGTRWLVIGGAVASLLAVVFLLKYVADRGLLGPVPRLIGGALFGLALWGVGLWQQGRLQHWAHAVIGGGTGVLFAVCWASSEWFQLVPREVAIAGITLVVGLTVVIAWWLRGQTLAFLALLLGYWAPALLSTGARTPIPLFVCLIVLGLAAQVLRHGRGFVWLLLLGAVANLFYGLVCWSWSFDLDGPRDIVALVQAAQLSALSLGVTLAVGVAWRTWRRLELASCDWTAAAIAFAPAFLLADATVLPQGLGGWWPPTLAGTTAAACFALAAWRARELPEGAERLRLLSALAAVSALLLGLDSYSLTAALALLGLGMVWLGKRDGSDVWSWSGAATLLYAALRCLDLRLRLVPDAAELLTAGGLPLLRAQCAGELVTIAALLAAGRVAPRWRADVKIAATVVALPFCGVELHAACGRWLPGLVDRAVWRMGSYATAAAAIATALAAVRTQVMTNAAAVVAALTALFAAFGANALQRGGPWLILNVPFLWLAAAAGTAAWLAVRLRRPPAAALATCALLVLLSVECYGFGDHQAGDQGGQVALSLCWTACASILLAVGFWRRLPPLRHAGLLLFAMLAVKLPLVDLAELDPLLRVLSFLALGLALMGAGWLYQRLQARLDRAA